MCNGTSSRVSQGGSIAVLRPTSPTLGANNSEEMRLLFSNGTQALVGRAGTQVEFQGREAGHNTRNRDDCWVVIHRDGDLSAPSTPLSEAVLNPFFSFSLDSGSTSVTHLSQTLDLGVGDAGIVGRRISLLRGSKMEPMTVAEGIIGWN